MANDRTGRRHASSYADDVKPRRAAGTVDDAVLRAAIDVLDDGVVVLDATGDVVFANPTFADLFGYEPDEILGRSFDELVPGAATSTGGELRGRDHNGQEFPVEIERRSVTTGSGEQTVAVVRDVTEYRETADRERVARDLHDTAIQRLFAAGMSLQGALSRSASADVSDRIEVAIEDIDATIRDIRTAIFSLQSRTGLPAGPRETVLAVVRESSPALGFAPHVEFVGLVDTETPDEVHEQLGGVLRDALTGVAEAGASRATVSVEVNDSVVLRVTHDGTGSGDGAFEWRAPAHRTR
jgi:signal transduction histidine kinase